MKMRELGQLKTKIAPIGIGAMAFSDFYGQATTDQANEVLKMALDLGVNHIDTSNIYGMGVSEERIGQFLKNNPNTPLFSMMS